jgi:hypothetical protein
MSLKSARMECLEDKLEAKAASEKVEAKKEKKVVKK